MTTEMTRNQREYTKLYDALLKFKNFGHVNTQRPFSDTGRYHRRLMTSFFADSRAMEAFREMMGDEMAEDYRFLAKQLDRINVSVHVKHNHLYNEARNAIYAFVKEYYPGIHQVRDPIRVYDEQGPRELIVTVDRFGDLSYNPNTDTIEMIMTYSGSAADSVSVDQKWVAAERYGLLTIDSFGQWKLSKQRPFSLCFDGMLPWIPATAPQDEPTLVTRSHRFIATFQEEQALYHNCRREETEAQIAEHEKQVTDDQANADASKPSLPGLTTGMD